MSSAVAVHRTIFPGVGHAGWGRRPSAKTAFLGVVLVLFIGYTEMAFRMDWVTQAGRIGPGFFPRVVGGLIIAITLIALVQSMRVASEDSGAADLEEDVGEADLGHHPLVMTVTVVASGAFILVLLSLGAIVAGALFLFGMLWFLNRGRWVANIVISVATPLALYLILQTGLNAGLPAGIIPAF
ncbi:tripartite tricarboxylate transporter TctB family protein [Cryobacterium aureum]|uniref:tripartite tricarboxylate transporter TctB family protein n=1 Tax=Cryobacterium aureum TaxID=995037 RepID=UPI000CF4E828|nr:tripartite tricarboxylate transporter TctB family protein [Cryobacterium aureum]